MNFRPHLRQSSPRQQRCRHYPDHSAPHSHDSAPESASLRNLFVLSVSALDFSSVFSSTSLHHSQITNHHSLSLFLSHSSTLSCTFLHSQKTQTPSFQSFPHSASKNRGGGCPVSRARPFRGDYHAPNKSPACPDLVGVTNHQSPPWLSAPLRRTVFGATIRKGTRNLYDPGKQLRHPRCLRLVSGHRGPFDDVPGYTPTQSGSQVVPGSSVLTRVSGFVLTNPEQYGPQQGGPSNPSVQDGALNRAGKAGSVRLG